MQLLVNILQDLKLLVLNPRLAFKTILNRSDWTLSKGHLVFIILMNTYFVFLPSALLSLNILAILFFFIAIGLMYYFMQEVLIVYQEQHNHDNSGEDMLYLIAYAFAIANLPAMILSVLVNIFAISLNENLLVGVFWAIVFSLPVLLIAVYYPLRLFIYINNDKASWTLMLELIIQSFIQTCKEMLGFRAVGDILIDWSRV